MHWNFRAVKTEHGIAVHGVYYDDDGKIISIDADPYSAVDDTVEDLLSQLTLICDEIKAHGVIEYPVK